MLIESGMTAMTVALTAGSAIFDSHGGIALCAVGLRPTARKVVQQWLIKGKGRGQIYIRNKGYLQAQSKAQEPAHLGGAWMQTAGLWPKVAKSCSRGSP